MTHVHYLIGHINPRCRYCGRTRLQLDMTKPCVQPQMELNFESPLDISTEPTKPEINPAIHTATDNRVA